MSCDHCNDFTNFGGTMGLTDTRPLASFYSDPRTRIVPHWHKPPSDRPPMVPIPPGPQAKPAFIVPQGYPAAVYSPGDAPANDGWVATSGYAQRTGGF